jgi:hypothetical protein
MMSGKGLRLGLLTGIRTALYPFFCSILTSTVSLRNPLRRQFRRSLLLKPFFIFLAHEYYNFTVNLAFAKIVLSSPFLEQFTDYIIVRFAFATSLF